MTKNTRRHLFVFSAFIVTGSALASSVVLLWRHIDRTRIIAAATTPDGIEMKVEQYFTRDAELFNTSFHYRAPGSNWVWNYYNHEDGYWGEGEIKLNASNKIATVLRGGKTAITFNWETKGYTNHRILPGRQASQ